MFSNLTSITFAAPYWLLLLLAIPVLAFLRGAPGKGPAVIFSGVPLLRDIGGPARMLPGFLTPSLVYGTFALCSIALARPQLVRTHEQVRASGIEIIVAIDVSLSMAIEDFTIGGKTVNRLAAAKKVTRQFIEGRRNDRIGLVAFAGRPYIPSPLTLDHEWLGQSLERVRIGLVEDGTAIGSAIGASTRRLDKRKSRSKIIVLITDGASNSGNLTPQDAARLAHTLGVKIYPIAVGTPGRHRIPIPGTNRFVQGFRQEFDVETMKEIASISEGRFYMAGDTQALERIFKTIDKLEKTEIFRRTIIESEDLFHWALWPALGIALTSLVLKQTLLRRVP